MGICLFRNWIENVLLPSYTKNDPSESVRVEAYNTSVNRQWSSFLCVLGLSSVLRLPIESYFPIPANQNDKKDSLSTMFNCTIFPRVSNSTTSDDKVHLFCCALMPVGYLENMKIPDTKNLMLPFVSQKMLLVKYLILNHLFQNLSLWAFLLPQQPKRKSQNPLHVSHPLHLCIPQPKLPQPKSLNSLGSMKAKRKQLVLEALFPKKREV